jgi:AraC-like DNA-binding protein
MATTFCTSDQRPTLISPQCLCQRTILPAFYKTIIGDDFLGTLRASCEEHLGMGPIRFLTLRRMHLVHQALLRADPSKSTVTGIVTDYGFWEPGRFSGTYRTFFGESPSATLRRSREIAPPTPAPQLSYRKAESFHPNY